jgi:hypothetical protein
MQRQNSPNAGKIPPNRLEKRDLVASVAYALWEDRKRRNLPDDREADWYRAEKLVTSICTNGGDSSDGEPD